MDRCGHNQPQGTKEFLREIRRRIGGDAEIAHVTEDVSIPLSARSPRIIFISPSTGASLESAIDHWLGMVPEGGAFAGVGIESHPGLEEALRHRFPIIQQEGDLWVTFVPSLLKKKLIHQIWLGKKPLPDWFADYRDSWLAHFPEWKYRLWRDEDLPGLLPGMISTTAFDHDLNVALRSDVLRLELLRKYGGMYVDVDFECMKPFGHLLLDGCFSYGDEARHRPGNALMAAPRAHGFTTFFLEAIARYLEGSDLALPLKPSVQNISGPDALHRALQAWVWEWEITDQLLDGGCERIADRFRDVVVFRTDALYPYGYDGRRKREWVAAKASGKIAETFPLAHAVHHWGGTWL